MNQQTNLICAVCGENDFEAKEGYYYCNECGTKSEQARVLEVEREDDFCAGTKHIKKIKIKTDKTSDKLELTSWECYNYILRGMVEELIELGAKDELKVMVFQIWAAFLRNKEVAFFSRRHPELPKLGIRFEEKDVAILYNHAKERHKARRERKENASIASGTKAWKKKMKNLDQSQYEASISQSQSMYSQSLMSQSSFADTSLNSSGSAPSNRAIQLKFSTNARKLLKKKMSLSHLKKHEKDFNSSLKCHSISIKTSELRYNDRTKELNMKLVYAILSVALNLIEDDIQLTDLLRFITEGHISTFNLERFFPPDTSEACKASLKTFRLNHKSREFAATQLREHCGQICKAIHLNHLKTPDIFKLVERYTKEMCLPEEINIFIERLINLHPPKMEWDCRPYTPCYESRAMAYIIFALKLLFGIDGRKEKQISRSARRVNLELSTMNENYDPLFVWDDWVEYIEFRKVLLCNNNYYVCKQFKQIPNRELYLQHLEERRQNTETNLSKDMIKKQANMSAVFQHFLNAGDKEDKDLSALNFVPSFTPCHNYLKRLKLDPKIKNTIPELLYVDHSKRTLMPFLKPTKLKEIFTKCNRKLSIIRLACTTKQNIVGIFQNPFLKYLNRNPKKINLTDDNGYWETKVEAHKPADTIFKLDLDRYTSRSSLKNLQKRFNYKEDINNAIKDEYLFLESKLEEDNMEPGEIRLTKPRRDLEKINIFADLSEDEDYEEIEESHQESFYNVSKTNGMEVNTGTKLKISNFDCWLLMGRASDLNETQANELKRNLQPTFFWLLETCALTIRVDWRELYDELMVLETFFAYAIEPLENLKDRVVFRNESLIKDINKIVRFFQSHW
ncbi:TATA box-binding protein-associated factor RNA polymerase I subunit B [Eupeodes corollae]|uniref:TATA box-binding protein-associated factor RNA polymerase I subunit B n=1 Tax=Eupeodes corollae TaxID=290404 RepID=UPI00249318EC|nr:TATA box-binding protein-associated factor RNA polymerase I subunit B [Eupeodes corollae]XP_055905661.1 TATA box-binding protein-associated factor RNA polymerase I subunit B [Eupeodes corollae]XP_055905662.1 TATA box-binding protein-associated factor RNA polymerase I subunit B [Eupeodes corollae]XP_055905663.1 TATA box-binding protein-associated factor RNA polymerase I subunit B [Eupeodes corollae]XP_055905664.1 TATA box-binding protein-associated factor RNA polymerase I subunit B [Eupeodes 